jgi:hypothetical protein
LAKEKAKVSQSAILQLMVVFCDLVGSTTAAPLRQSVERFRRISCSVGDVAKADLR